MRSLKTISHFCRQIIVKITGLYKVLQDFKTNWEAFQKWKKEGKKKRRKIGEKRRKGRRKKKIRTKIEVWWAKKEKWKAKKMILPLRFWEAFSNQV